MDGSRSLADELAELKANSRARVSPERFAMVEAAIARLKDEGGVEDRALRAGDLAPDAALTCVDGRRAHLSAMWRQGPLVLVFYRGGWCPYCNLQLRAWQRVIDRLSAHGARLVAVSPQTPDHSMATAHKHALGFEVVSDSALEAAEAFRIAYTLPDELIDLYGRLGHELPVLNGNGRWALPMTATYLIDRRGLIAYAHVNADYRERADPNEVLSHLEALERVAVTPPAA